MSRGPLKITADTCSSDPSLSATADERKEQGCLGNRPAATALTGACPGIAGSGEQLGGQGKHGGGLRLPPSRVAREVRRGGWGAGGGGRMSSLLDH